MTPGVPAVTGFGSGEPRTARKVIRLLNSQEAVSATGFPL